MALSSPTPLTSGARSGSRDGGLSESPSRRQTGFHFHSRACYPDVVRQTSRSLTMEWTTPQHEEIDLNCEISSYANAEI